MRYREVSDEACLHWFVVVGDDGEDGCAANVFALLRGCHHLLRAVAARSADHLYMYVSVGFFFWPPPSSYSCRRSADHLYMYVSVCVRAHTFFTYAYAYLYTYIPICIGIYLYGWVYMYRMPADALARVAEHTCMRTCVDVYGRTNAYIAEQERVYGSIYMFRPN